MRNRFKLNESEKNRIRGLHGLQVINEQSNKTPTEEYVRAFKETQKLLKDALEDKQITLYNGRDHDGNDLDGQEGDVVEITTIQHADWMSEENGLNFVVLELVDNVKIMPATPEEGWEEWEVPEPQTFNTIIWVMRT